MTSKFAAMQAKSSVCTSAVRLALAGAALGFSCVAALAQAPAQASALAPQTLEREFWRCDYAATTRLLDAGTAAECSAVTEELCRRWFAGDFNTMLAWWRQGKAAAHQALAAAERATTTTPVSDAVSADAARWVPSTRRSAAAEAAGAVPPVDPLRGRLEGLTASQIKQVYLNCSNQAIERRLDGGEAARCSIAYDVLLKRHFGGNFDALLAWSRQQGGAETQSPADRAAARPDRSMPTEQREI